MRYNTYLTKLFHPGRVRPISFFHPASGGVCCWLNSGFIHLTLDPPCCIPWFPLWYACVAEKILPYLRVFIQWQNGDTDFFSIDAEVLQEKTLTQFLFILCLDYILWTFIDLIKENGVMVIVVGNGHADMSSNPGRDWLHFHIALIP